MKKVDIDKREFELLENIKTNLPGLKEVLKKKFAIEQYTEYVYRLYYYSFKVEGIHGLKPAAVEVLESLAPSGTELCPLFMEIIGEMPKQRDFAGQQMFITTMSEDNEKMIANGRRGLEAYNHIKFFIEQAVKYGSEMEAPPENPIPYGWAALLTLYGLR